MYSTAMAVERLKTVSTAMAVECFNNVAVELQSGCRKKSGCRKTGNHDFQPKRILGRTNLNHGSLYLRVAVAISC